MSEKRFAIIEHDEDGWWAYYTDGWKSSTDVIGAQHQDHADTRTDLLKLVKGAIACNCESCKGHGESTTDELCTTCGGRVNAHEPGCSVNLGLQ